MNPANDRQHQFRAGRRLEYFTLGWNLTEAAVAIGAGLFAGSIALIGFGIDSLIESLSGGILLWRLQWTETDESRERVAHRLVGISFFCSRYTSRLKQVSHFCVMKNRKQAWSVLFSPSFP